MKIEAAVKAFTDCVRKTTGYSVSNVIPGPLPSEIGQFEQAEWQAAIECICKDMDALALDQGSTFGAFEQLRHRMGATFPATPPKLLQDVAGAFSDAGRLSP
jgi:hypothetical protein